MDGGCDGAWRPDRFSAGDHQRVPTSGKRSVEGLTLLQCRGIKYIVTRTQIQLPDALHDQAKRLASSMEVSLTELVRRGLEQVIATHPLGRAARGAWRLDPPTDAGVLRDPFSDPDWRVAANLSATATETVGMVLNDRPARKA